MSRKWSRRSSGSALSYWMAWSWLTYWSLNFSDFSELTSLSFIWMGYGVFSAKSLTSASSLGVPLEARMMGLASAFLV